MADADDVRRLALCPAHMEEIESDRLLGAAHDSHHSPADAEITQFCAVFSQLQFTSLTQGPGRRTGRAVISA